jgi:hypothetical protein
MADGRADSMQYARGATTNFLSIFNLKMIRMYHLSNETHLIIIPQLRMLDRPMLQRLSFAYVRVISWPAEPACGMHAYAYSARLEH